jgi:hypothetical protein
MKHYRDHDPIMQGLYYSRHVEAMTAEGLHDKGAIASELAARDIRIELLEKELWVVAECIFQNVSAGEMKHWAQGIKVQLKGADTVPSFTVDGSGVKNG